MRRLAPPLLQPLPGAGFINAQTGLFSAPSGDRTPNRYD